MRKRNNGGDVLSDRFGCEKDKPERAGPVPKVLLFFDVAACKHHGAVRDADNEER